MCELAIGIHAAGERRPCLAHRRFIGGAVKQSLIHAPGKTVGIKTGAAGFLERIAVWVEQTRAPEPVGLLAGENFFGHVLEQLLEAWTVGMICRQVLQHSHDAREHPAIAAAPENFLAICLGLFEIGAVAEVKMLVLVVEIIRRAPPVRHRKIQILLVTGRRIKPHPSGRRHEQCVAP